MPLSFDLRSVLYLPSFYIRFLYPISVLHFYNSGTRPPNRSSAENFGYRSHRTFAMNKWMKRSNQNQQSFFNSYGKSTLCYGGELRRKRYGRQARPLSSKDSHHIVFKIVKANLRNKSFRHPKNFLLIQQLLNKYSKRFFVKIQQVSFQHDHIHIMARSSRRSNFHYFFRVFAGQIAQNMKVTDTPSLGVQSASNPKKRLTLWKGRPFTRIVKGWKNYCTLRNYIQLNEKEVTLKIPYRKTRLKGLSASEWELLWS